MKIDVDKSYRELANTEKGLFCCDSYLHPLLFIQLKSKSLRGHDCLDDAPDHYFNVAFECSKCGIVYEIWRVSHAYTCIGDFMCPNYTSYSYIPSLRWLNQPNDIAKINKLYHNKEQKLRDSIYDLEGQINTKISRIQMKVGSLNNEQYKTARKSIAPAIYKEIKNLNNQIETLSKQRLLEIRKALCLPLLPNLQETEKLNKQFEIRGEIKKLDEQIKGIDTENFGSVEKLSDMLQKKEVILSQLEINQ